MASSPPSKKKYWLMISLLGVLLFSIISILVIFKQNDVDQQYYHPFAQKVEAAKEYQKEMEAQEPQAPGFRESDITKFKGKRYDTY